MAEWRILYHTDEDPQMTGWWLVLVDPSKPDGPYDDSIGPYDTREIAQRMKDLPE